MKTTKLKEIIKIVIFIKDIRKTDLADKLSFSYTALNNFLVRHSKMNFDHIEEIFKALGFDFSMALVLSEKNLSRKELIESILKIMR